MGVFRSKVPYMNTVGYEGVLFTKGASKLQADAQELILYSAAQYIEKIERS